MSFFDDFSAVYDLMFPWEQRLKNEGGFFRELFTRNGVRSVLDCACGTGMHAIRFAESGLAVAGSDLSPRMIETAAANTRRAGVKVDWRVSSYTALSEAFGPTERFDAVICVGNSLTLALSDSDVALALRQMAGVLRPGGTVVIHVFNWDKLAEEHLRIMPAVSVVVDGQETFLLRVFHHRGDVIDLNIAVLRKRPDGVDTSVVTARQRPVGPVRLAEFARAAGFGEIDLFGGYARPPFDARTSDQVVLVGRKTSG